MEKYEVPEMEIIRFEAEDVITASGGPTDPLAASETGVDWFEQ